MMNTEYRPDVLGDPQRLAKTSDPAEAIQVLEDEIKQMAESLRRTRLDFVNGMLNRSEFEAVEAKFGQMLVEHRQILQNLRKAAQPR